MSKKVFEKINLGGIEVNNRFIRSATVVQKATIDGYVTEDLLDIYRELSEGQVGLIITGTMGIIEGADDSKLLRIHDDSYLEGLKKLVDVAHKNHSKIIPQLGHGGTLQMTKVEIQSFVEQFGEVALRSKKAGFDGVQVHAAHGFLFSKFLSPYHNRRTDEYGGSLENRTRIMLEVLNSIKIKCGIDFPVFIKINSSDFFENGNGFTFEECKEAAKIFADAGFDAIEISGGAAGGEYGPARSKIHLKEQEAYHKDYAAEIAREVSIPVILVGGIRSLEVAEDILEETNIEAISFSRPLIREPQLIKRWIEGNTEKAKCVSCNRCFNPEGASCIFNK